MTKKQYIPNFKDKRVVARIRRAHGFAKAMLREAKWVPCSRTMLDKHLGLHNSDLGRYLRWLLLIGSAEPYSMHDGVVKRYKLNKPGLDFLRYQINTPNNDYTYHDHLEGKVWIDTTSEQALEYEHKLSHETVSEAYHATHGEELTSLNFIYNDKSSRLWHPIQNIKREYKTKLLEDAGLKYHYDIVCCAPTLIAGHAKNLGMETYPEYIYGYIECRDAVRESMAIDLGVDEESVKRAILALFCGARCGTNERFAIFNLLGSVKAVTEFREHFFVKGVREEIKDCWEAIRPTIGKRTIEDKNGIERVLPISSRQKWGVYFDIERTVLNAVSDYLDSYDNGHFLEHDGWSCEDVVDTVAASAYIKAATGFEIEIVESD
jgi:hypothetical protein